MTCLTHIYKHGSVEICLKGKAETMTEIHENDLEQEDRQGEDAAVI